MKLKQFMKRIVSGILTASLVCTALPAVLPGTQIESKASSREHVVVVLDPGHGGAARNEFDGMSEADLNLKIALACRDYLNEYEGIDVIMTREADFDLSLAERTRVAVKNNADLLVSIHNDAVGRFYSAANGAKVFISRVQPFYSNTYPLAQEICDGLSSMCGLQNIGVKTRACTYEDAPDEDYYSMIGGPAYNGIPGMIIEHAFYTNDHDRAILSNDDNLRKMGYADAIAIAHYFNLSKKGSAPSGNATLETTGYMQGYGWTATSPNGCVAGFDTYRAGQSDKEDHYHGRDVRMEAFKIDVNNNGVDGNIEYSAFVGYAGNAEIERSVPGNRWLDFVSNGGVAGTTGQSRAVEAIKVRLTGALADKYDVYYRVKSGSLGWMGWTMNGQPAGQSGSGEKVRAIQVKLVAKGGAAPGSMSNSYNDFNVPDEALIKYSTHVQTYGDQPFKVDGATSGTTGESKRLESIRIAKGPALADISGDIRYRVHCQTYGWMDWKKNGDAAGTSGESKRLEAIQIKLTGELAEKYDVYYRVHAQTFGWLAWAKNGEYSGTAGYSKRLEGIQIKLVEKNGESPVNDSKETESYKVTGATNNEPLVSYTTHVQRKGWLGCSTDGAPSGSVGESLRMEGVKIYNNTEFEGDVRYAVHCQTYGWMDWRANGQMAGTTGESKRLEAIRIELTGELAEKYDVYYRVHAQQFGWMDWAKNGEDAGTAGFSYRLESLQVVFVEKDGKAPGPTAKPFVSR